MEKTWKIRKQKRQKNAEKDIQRKSVKKIPNELNLFKMLRHNQNCSNDIQVSIQKQQNYQFMQEQKIYILKQHYYI